jgi:hypothetical protein
MNGMRMRVLLIIVIVLLLLSNIGGAINPKSFISKLWQPSNNIWQPSIRINSNGNGTGDTPYVINNDSQNYIPSIPPFDLQNMYNQGNDKEGYNATGKIFGGTGHGSHFFTYDILTNNFMDKGIPISGEQVVYSLTQGIDNEYIYGGTAYSAHFLIYNLSNDSFIDKGSFGDGVITSLTRDFDGKIYGGVSLSNDNSSFFEYDPSTDTITDLPIRGPEEITFGATSTTGTDKKIYMATLKFINGTSDIGVHVLSYDPPVDGNGSTVGDSGNIFNGTYIPYSATYGLNNKIYFGIYGSVDGYNPLRGYLLVYDTKTNKAKKITPVNDAIFVWALTTHYNGKIYGGATVNNSNNLEAHFFEYDPSTDTVKDKGIPVANQNYICSLITYEDGLIYGGTCEDGNNTNYLFTYNTSTDSFNIIGEAVSGENGISALAPKLYLLNVTKPQNPPVAEAGPDRNARINQNILLPGIGTDSDGFTTLYEWDFEGDGIYDWNSTLSGITTHAYKSPGLYHATFRVTDNDNLTGIDSARMCISKPPYYDPKTGRGTAERDPCELD